MKAFTASLLLLTSVILPAFARDGGITFKHRARSLHPGELVVLEARSAAPLSRLKVKAFNREFAAFSPDGGHAWTCLVGIDLETGPGNYRVELQGIDNAGRSVAAEGLFKVTAKEFPTRVLTVDPKYVSPPAKVLPRIQEERRRVDSIFSAVSPERLWNGPFRRPVPGAVISAFGKRSVYNGKPRSPHGGVDFRGASGTPVHAPNSGVVVLASNLYYSGNTIILDHGLGLYSYFGHLSVISVKEGAMVKTGEVIGKVGATGVVTGPHLHWTVRLGGSRIDPIALLALLGKEKS